VTAPRILIIDDETAIRQALRRFFTRQGWEVDEAENGADALVLILGEGAAPARDYDVIVSDLRMPGVSGMDLHDRVRERRPEIASRMIFSTGDATSASVMEFVHATGCTVLQKPFELATLRETVERIRSLQPPTV
jgi:DNA-binding NtrC family response regulator